MEEYTHSQSNIKREDSLEISY